jgi:hypothetical protein
LVCIEEKSLNSKFKPHNIYNTNQTCKDFISVSEIHSELLLKYYSCYSDTTGVTPALQWSSPQVLLEHNGVVHGGEDLVPHGDGLDLHGPNEVCHHLQHMEEDKVIERMSKRM